MRSHALASTDMSMGMYICTFTCISRERQRHRQREEKRGKKNKEKGGREKKRDIFLKKTEKQHRKLAPMGQ